MRDELLGIVDEELRSAMGLIDESQYAEVFARYVNHVSHWVKKERLVNPITGQLEEPDANMMAEIEKAIGITGKAEDHRRDLMRRIAAWSIDHAAEMGQKRGLQHLDFAAIFPEQFQRLRESYFADRKKQLRKINEDLLVYLNALNEGGAQAPLDRESAERVKTTLKNLKERYHYDEDSARDAISFLLRRRYT